MSGQGQRPPSLPRWFPPANVAAAEAAYQYGKKMANAAEIAAQEKDAGLEWKVGKIRKPTLPWQRSLRFIV